MDIMIRLSHRSGAVREATRLRAALSGASRSETIKFLAPCRSMTSFTRTSCAPYRLLMGDFRRVAFSRSIGSYPFVTLGTLSGNSAFPLHQSCATLPGQTLSIVRTLASSSRPPVIPPGRGKNDQNNNLARGALGVVGAASLLFGKTKYVLAALKVTKLSSLASMAVTVGTYSMFFGWPYAVGMVGLIFIHETGHALVMLQRGIPFSPMVFVPFMGAAIAMKEQPRNAYEDALVAFGGPVLGSLGAAGVAVAAAQTQSQLLYALADFGFMINLFNLLPIGSMDGGRITGALSPYAGVVGLGLGGMLAYQGYIHNPIFYLILLAGGYETFQRFYNPAAYTPPNYYKITMGQRIALTSGYFGLISALIMAMGVNQQYRKPPEVLMREREIEKTWDMR